MPITKPSTLRPGLRLLSGVAALLWLLSLAANAYERDYYFERIDSSQGLAQNSVSVIFQDDRGYLWLGTQGGLHRYDGYELKRFRHDASRRDSLPDNLVSAMASAGKGRVWVGTSSAGLVLFDADRDRVVPAPGDWSGRLHDVTALSGGDGKRLLVGTPRGVFALDPPYTTLRRLWPPDPADGTPVTDFTRCRDGRAYALNGPRLLVLGADAMHTRAVRIGTATPRTLLCRDNGQLLLGTADGLFRLDPESGSGTRIWPTTEHWTPSSSDVRALAQDHAGRTWAAIAGVGLLRLDRDGDDPRMLRPRPDVPGTLPEANIATLFVDRSGLLWAGGITRGAAYTNPAGTPFRFVFDEQPSDDPITANNVRSFFEDTDGKLWLGMAGAGLRRYDPQDRRFDDFTPALAAALPAGAARDLRVYAVARHGGELWLASNRGMLALDVTARSARRLPQLNPKPARDALYAGARALLHERDGSWWIGLMDGGVLHVRDGRILRRYRHRDGDPESLGDDTVLTLAQDRDGRIWAGTADGLSVIDPGTQRVRTFREQAGADDSLSGRVITDLFVDRHGVLWVGTQSGLNRLLRLDGDSAHFQRFLVRDGLPDSTIYCALEDGAGRLWLSSNRGIARLDPRSGEVVAFSPREGLQGMEYNSGACLRAGDGSLLFGGVNGFDRVDPAGVHASDFRPDVDLTGIYVGASTQPVAPPAEGPLRMPAAAQAIRFEFAAMDFAAPQHNRFQYRLVGFDPQWIDAGTRRSAAYTNLDAGRYRFEVRGSNHSGRFGGPPAGLELVVVPPWWASRAMRALYAAAAGLIVLAIVAAVRARRAEERRHQDQLREREDRLSMALWGSGDEFWDLDLREGRLYRLGASQLLGVGAADQIAFDDWRSYVVHPDDIDRVERHLREYLEGRIDHFETEYRLKNTSGAWIWILARGKIVERDAHGGALRLSGTARDITRSRAEDADRRIAAEVIRSMTEAVTVTDLQFRFCSVNAAFSRMTGYAEDEVLGRDAWLLNCRHQSDEIYERVRRELERQGHWRGELWQRRKNGGDFLCWVELGEVCNAHGVRTHYVAVMTDITDRKRAEQELRYLANYDMLTGLPNRTLLGERLGDAILRARRREGRVAVLYVDLDRFKHVNDSMGHTTGDRLLKAAGARLRQCVREQDTVARVGGDEFTLVLEDVSGTEDVAGVARKITDAFNRALVLDTRQEVLISPSIGIALYPDHGQVPNDLLKHADTAMYQAKERGRNTWMFYTEAMDANARLRATMAGALRRALERKEMDVVYQPKFSLDDNQVVGVEALLRWHSVQLGEVPPSVFVPLAEETGLIVEIGQFVLERACSDLREWREEGLGDLSVAVNLSMAQLQRSELAGGLARLLADSGVPPHCLELELTESMVMGNIEQSMRTLGELKAIGLTLAIDDFGTGYSSLAYLKRLPLDVLKIDKTFVGDITTDPDDEAITTTIITMAHSLGLRVVAEGVETAEQAAYLRGHDCDLVQGNWLSPPLRAGQCLRFCLDHHASVRLAQATPDDD